MEQKDLIYMSRENILSNLVWKFFERCGTQIVTFIVSIILARILNPEVYGIIGLVTVFMEVFQVFVDSGLGNALVQKKEADDADFSTVFYANMCICLLIYMFIFSSAPIIAKFYNDETLTLLIRLLGITVIVSGLKNVQQAYVAKKMMFKKFFNATLGGTIVAAGVGIYLALSGFGVWSLAVQQITKITVDTMILWITVKWRPKRTFSFVRFKRLFSFGWKLLAASLINSLYSNMRQLIIGKRYTTTDLAFYNRGMQFPSVIVSNVNASIDSVLLPTMSKIQEDKKQVKRIMRRAIKISTYIMAPMMMGLAFTAPIIVKVVLTDKWLPCIPFLRIFCITYMFYPIHSANLNAINAMGHSEIFLKLEIMKKIIGIVLLFSTMWFGIMAMTYSLLFSSIISQLINSWPNWKMLDYSYGEQLKDIFPSIFLAVLMGVIVTFVELLNLSLFNTLLLQIIVGICIYIFGSIVLKIDSFYYLLNIIMPRLKRIFK